MMEQHDQPTGRTVIEQVRDLMPRRPLMLSEAYSVAEKQAYTLLRFLHRPARPTRHL